MGRKKKGRSTQRKIRQEWKKASAALATPGLDAAAENLPTAGGVPLLRDGGCLAKVMKLYLEEQQQKQLLRMRFHPEDDLDRVLDHLQSKKIETKFLAKCMPNLTKDLKEGKVLPEVVAHGIILDYYRPKFKLPDPMLLACGIYERVADLALECAPKRLLCTEYYDTVKVHLASGETPLSCGLPRRINEACEMLAPQFDKKLFGNKKGAFLKSCAVYGLTKQRLYQILGGEVEDLVNRYEMFFEVENLLGRALAWLAEDVHETRKSCWECGAADAPRTCSKCHSAHYCDQKCQKAAWCSGHREMCKNLAAEMTAFEESIRALDEVHSLPHDHFVKITDYVMLQVIHGYPSMTALSPALLEGTQLESLGGTKMEKPCMKYFHQNFLLVLGGKWWVISNPDTMDIYTHRQSNMDFEEAKRQEDKAFAHIVWLLAHDHLGFLKRANLWNPTTSSEDQDGSLALKSLFEKMKTLLPEFFKEIGDGMPAGRFVHLYREGTNERFVQLYRDGTSSNSSEKSTSGWSRRRRDLIKVAHKILKAHHHKGLKVNFKAERA